MKIINNRVAAVIGGAVVLAALSGTSGAYASHLIGSADIRDGAVHRVDLSDGVNTALARHAKAGKDGKDGAPGLSNVNAGADYTHNWAGDNGAKLNTIIETCPDGQVALGGGYSTWGGTDTNAGGTPYDLGGDNKDIQVTVSAPYSEEKYDENKYGGNIRPTEWIVKGYNNGGTDQIVRAWVVCANAK